MNVIIDGIEYKPVEQNVDQEREKVIARMIRCVYANSKQISFVTADCTALYNAGYRKVGEAVSRAELIRYFINAYKDGSFEYDAITLLDQFDLTKKVVK